PRRTRCPPPEADATPAGGSFDTLEAGQTAPSDSPMVLAANAATRTGAGGPPPSGPQPPFSWSARTNQSGETLRLDALGSDADRAEAPTRTAAPSVPPETPPP